MSQLAIDLEEILARSDEDLRVIVNKSVLMTGGTGFVGSWLTESWDHACRRLGGRGRLSIVSRDPDNFLAQHRLVSEKVDFVKGDIRSFKLGQREVFDLVIHAATPARASLNSSRPSEMLNIILDGQSNLLDQLSHGAPPRFLFTSSGAVYGPQPSDVPRVPESQLTGPNILDPSSAYHEGKRMAELQLTIASTEGLIDSVIARLFAFFGPYLPLDEHFAIGNFIRDALAGGPIIVRGDGTTVRSYQYPIDMVSWLWTLAERGGRNTAYNVGSDQGMSMREIADAVSRVFGDCGFEIQGTPKTGTPIDRYVPSVDRVKTELNLTNHIDFTEGLRRTMNWYRKGFE